MAGHYSLYLGLALASLLFVLATRRRRAQAHGLQLPPGPWQLPVIGSLHHVAGRLPHRALRDLARRHGPVMLLRMGEVPTVVVSSREAAREVMKTHDAAFASRPLTATLAVLTTGGRDIIFAPYGEHWRHLRRLAVTELLSARRVLSFRAVREEEVAAMLRTVAASAGTGGAAAVDMRARLSAGRPRTFLGCFLGYRRTASSRCRWTWTSLKRSSLGLNMIEHLRLSVYYTDACMRDIFAAGTETSATALEWAMAELVRNPAAMRRATAEVRRAFAAAGAVGEHALGELRYLPLVVREALRLYPPVPLLLPRESGEPRRLLGRYDVPRGATVLVNAWALGRDERYWPGGDHEAFRPERFDGGAAAAAVDFRGADFELVPFGAGRRMCPGVAFALAALLFHFDWEAPAAGAADAAELDMTEAFGVATRRKEGLLLRAILRVPVPGV
ncbi:hypothetical protein ACP4OV_015013 [Aristida adscensionis]